MKGVSVIISEIDGPGRLPCMSVCHHYRIKNKSNIWLKENLINMAVRNLPENWKYVAWIDADISFLNSEWVQETLEELKTHDIVQLFHTAINMGPNGEALKIDKSFAYMYKDSGTPYVSTDRYGFWHPGYAWACTRRAWKKMGGLLEWAILGSGDRHLALALTGKVLQSCPGNIHKNYKAMLEEFQARCRGLELSWVKGTIVHHWHGKLENRKYKERWDILTANKYDPFTDIEISDRGLIKLSKAGERLKKPIDEYFIERREDS